jgi:hypothetical protein
MSEGYMMGQVCMRMQNPAKISAHRQYFEIIGKTWFNS